MPEETPEQVLSQVLSELKCALSALARSEEDLKHALNHIQSIVVLNQRFGTTEQPIDEQ